MPRESRDALVDAYKSDNFGEDEADQERSPHIAQAKQDVDPRPPRENQGPMNMHSKALPQYQQQWLESDPYNQYRPMNSAGMANNQSNLSRQPMHSEKGSAISAAREPQQMYNQLYHKVMQTKSPSGATQARILNN